MCVKVCLEVCTTLKMLKTADCCGTCNCAHLCKIVHLATFPARGQCKEYYLGLFSLHLSVPVNGHHKGTRQD